jgi:hypothetical protein
MIYETWTEEDQALLDEILAEAARRRAQAEDE